MGDILLPFQMRLLRQTFLQVLVVVLIQAVCASLFNPYPRIVGMLWGFTAMALVAWLSVSERHRGKAFTQFAAMQVALLVAPWFMGGVRTPAAYFSLILLHPLALLFGMRVAWMWVAAFVADVLLLMIAEIHGWIPGMPPTPLATISTLTAMIAYTLFFIASPLVYIRRLFDVASHHLAERRAVDAKLVALAGELEERVVARSGELIEGRGRLQAMALENAHKLSEEIELLRGAVSAVEEAYGGMDTSVKASKSLDRIRQAQGRLERMHEALLRFCQIAGMQPRVQGISPSAHVDLVESVWEELSDRNGSSVRLNLGSLPGCKADPDLLRHVWQNLLSNAIKYSSRSLSPTVEVFQEQGGMYVRDNGVGFDSEKAQNLFGLFQRLHPVDDFSGNGVGLAIAHRIIELHGGGIRATSVPGEGATFVFSLPAFRRPESEFGLAPIRI